MSITAALCQVRLQPTVVGYPQTQKMSAHVCCTGVTRLVTREQGIFKYFLKVVPTTYKRGFSAPSLPAAPALS